MSKKYYFIFGLIVLVAAICLYTPQTRVQAADNMYQGATIPTRTPTGSPVTNTPVPPGNQPTSPPPANSTTVPATTPTSTLIPATIAATPLGGFIETAVPCSGNPTVQAINTTRVRQGPGTEYAVMAELVYLEVRPIAARAAYAPWWLIILGDGRYGWVANDVVQVQGYTAIVPIAEAPPLNGGTATPGTPWLPTPNPTCTVTPIPTATATATLLPSATPTSAEISQESVTPLPPASPTTVPPTATATVISQVTTAVETSTPIATAVPLNPGDGSNSGGGNSFNINFLLVGALGLTVLGGVAFFILKQRPVSLN